MQIKMTVLQAHKVRCVPASMDAIGKLPAMPAWIIRDNGKLPACFSHQKILSAGPD